MTKALSTFAEFVDNVVAERNDETAFTGNTVTIDQLKSEFGLPFQVFRHKTKDGKESLHWRVGPVIGPISERVRDKIDKVDPSEVVIRELEDEDGSTRWMLTFLDTTDSAVRVF